MSSFILEGRVDEGKKIDCILLTGIDNASSNVVLSGKRFLC